MVDVEAAETAVRQVLPQTILNPLFAACRDEELMLLGVPEVLLPAVRAVGNEEALARLIELSGCRQPASMASSSLLKAEPSRTWSIS